MCLNDIYTNESGYADTIDTLKPFLVLGKQDYSYTILFELFVIHLMLSDVTVFQKSQFQSYQSRFK